MIDWKHATLEEIGQQLDDEMERLRVRFPEYTTGAQYASEQRAPDPDENTEDLG